MVKATNGGICVVWKLAFRPPVVALNVRLISMDMKGVKSIICFTVVYFFEPYFWVNKNGPDLVTPVVTQL